MSKTSQAKTMPSDIDSTLFWICPHCGITYPTKKEISTHMKKEHQKTDKEIEQFLRNHKKNYNPKKEAREISEETKP